MKTVFYLLDAAPYGSEKAFGLLNGGAIGLSRGAVTLGLYADGVYMGLAGQEGGTIGMPNLSDLIYAYPEFRVIAHEPSVLERAMLGERLIEAVELMDDDEFMEEIAVSEGLVLL